jgi:hypothetical protein
MFKTMRIYLTGPICKCTKQSLVWRPSKDHKGLDILIISCTLCKEQMVVANHEWRASFDLEIPYGEGIAPETPKVEESKTTEVLFEDKTVEPKVNAPIAKKKDAPKE